MSNEVFRIDDLPEEVLEHIFAFLPLSDRKSASLVCTKWGKLAFCRRFLRTVVLDIHLNRPLQIATLLKSKRRYRNVFVIWNRHEFCFQTLMTTLELFAADVESFHYLGNLDTKQLSTVLSRLSNLQELKVGFDDDDEGSPPLEPLEDFELQIGSLDVPNVVQLHVTLSEAAEGKNLLPVLRRLAPQLKNVDIFSMDYFIPLEQLQFPKAEVLNIGGYICDTENDCVLRTFFAGFRLLKKVRLDSIIKEIGLDVITSACPGIELLKFGGLRSHSIPFHMLRRLKYLKTLGLGIVDEVPDMSLNCSPMISVENLSLELSKCEDSSIERLHHLLPNVIAMNVAMRNDWNIEKGLKHICQNFRGLQRLEISEFGSWQRKLGNSSLRMLEHLEQLEELTFKNMRTRIIDIPSNPLLKRFVMYFPDSLSDGDLLELARQYPNLRVLDLGPYGQITSEGIAAFKSILVNCAVQRTPVVK